MTACRRGHIRPFATVLAPSRTEALHQQRMPSYAATPDSLPSSGPVRHYHLAIFVHEPAVVRIQKDDEHRLRRSQRRSGRKGVSPGAVARCSILTGTVAQVPSGAQQREAAHECPGADRVQEGRVRSRKRQRAPRLARAWAFVRALAADPKPGVRAIRARAAIFCPRESVIPSSASACIT